MHTLPNVFELAEDSSIGRKADENCESTAKSEDWMRTSCAHIDDVTSIADWPATFEHGALSEFEFRIIFTQMRFFVVSPRDRSKIHPLDPRFYFIRILFRPVLRVSEESSTILAFAFESPAFSSIDESSAFLAGVLIAIFSLPSKIIFSQRNYSVIRHLARKFAGTTEAATFIWRLTLHLTFDVAFDVWRCVWRSTMDGGGRRGWAPLIPLSRRGYTPFVVEVNPRLPNLARDIEYWSVNPS